MGILNVSVSVVADTVVSVVVSVIVSVHISGVRPPGGPYGCMTGHQMPGSADCQPPGGKESSRHGVLLAGDVSVNNKVCAS